MKPEGLKVPVGHAEHTPDASLLFAIQLVQVVAVPEHAKQGLVQAKKI